MKAVQRETFIALRARRQSHQIASAIINPSLDLHQPYCRQCGEALRIDRLEDDGCIVCRACSRVNQLPSDLASEVRRRIPVRDSELEPETPPLPRGRRPLTMFQLLALIMLVFMLAGLAVLFFAALFEARGNLR